ncbi:MAG: hypothetical protein ACYDER_01260 [Ktedonobacteraceae bacterium]
MDEEGQSNIPQMEPDKPRFSHLAGKHLYMHDPRYERILKESRLLGDEGGCWFGALATLSAAIKRVEPGEELERVLDIFSKYDDKYLTGANELLPQEERVQGLESMRYPFVDESGGVSFGWFLPKHIDNTLKLINAMLAKERMGIKLGGVDLRGIVHDEIGDKGLIEEYEKTGIPSRDIFQRIAARRIGSKLLGLFEDYARHNTGVILNVENRYKDRESIYHVVAVPGVIKVKGREDALIIDDPAQKESFFLLNSEVGSFFLGLDEGIPFNAGDREGTVKPSFIVPSLIVKPNSF